MVTASAGGAGPPGTRSRELQDPFNRYLYHPLAARLARLLLPTGISPNAVSVLGMLLVWAAAWSFAMLPWPAGALLGFGLVLLWHVFDGADGDLARLKGTVSATGELVDGVCDYCAQAMLYVVLAAMLANQIGAWAWVLAVSASASHIAQTNHAETHRRTYLWWAYGIPWLKNARDTGDEVFREESWFSRMFAWGARGYLDLADWMAPWSSRVDALVDAAAGDEARLGEFRQVVRGSSRAALVYEKIVGPNPRTLLLGASMLLGSPVWFFLGEAVLLNLVLGASIVHHNKIGRMLVQRLT